MRIYLPVLGVVLLLLAVGINVTLAIWTLQALPPAQENSVALPEVAPVQPRVSSQPTVPQPMPVMPRADNEPAEPLPVMPRIEAKYRPDLAPWFDAANHGSNIIMCIPATDEFGDPCWIPSLQQRQPGVIPKKLFSKRLFQ